MDYILGLFNPSTHMTNAQYVSWWQGMFSTVLLGFWSRLFAAAFTAMAIWFGVRARNVQGALFCLLIAVLIAYGAAILRFLGMLKI